MNYWQSENGLIRLHCGDCIEMMQALEPDSIDSIVTDPPYGLKFMGKAWDHGVPGVPFWTEALRVAKPGSHLLAFGGTRTHHRLMCAIEDAGWEIRDCLGWIYGSGFPKSLDVSKAIDKAAGVEREVVGVSEHGSGPHRIKLDNHGKGDTGIGYMDGSGKVFFVTAPATSSAIQWQGWGTALKPAWEPIVLARKPLEGTVAENVQKWGCGAINVDECRIPSNGNVCGTSKSHSTPQEGWDRPWRHDAEKAQRTFEAKQEGNRKAVEVGRFPANILHDGSEEVMAVFPNSRSTGGKGSASGLIDNEGIYGKYSGDNKGSNAGGLGDSGSAARFFYCAKASKAERDYGLDGPESPCGMMEDDNYPIKTSVGNIRDTKRRNTHPTVKPLSLMRYLCRLITPPGGNVLDIFMGSGSTGIAAAKEGFGFIGCDNVVESYEIAVKRIENHIRQGRLF